jgi:hypothetical protein
MATASTPEPQTRALVADSISITCPPIPGGGGHGLLLQPNFKVCGNWDSSSANAKVTCEFIGAAGATTNGTMTVNQPPPNTWSATFNVAAGTNGKLVATIKVNNVVTAQANVTNLQVVANGGGTCNC